MLFGAFGRSRRGQTARPLISRCEEKMGISGPLLGNQSIIANCYRRNSHRTCDLIVTGKIVIALCAELRRYGIWVEDGGFAELLRILEGRIVGGVEAGVAGASIIATHVPNRNNRCRNVEIVLLASCRPGRGDRI